MDLDLYIDIIFFVNFFMDFLLLVLSRGILRKSVSYRRLGGAAALGGALGCLEIFCVKMPGWMWVVFLFGTAGFMAAAAFGWSGWKELIKETGTLFMLAVLAGGVMELFYAHTRAGFYLLNIYLGEDAYAVPLLCWGLMAAGTFFLIRGLWQFGDEIRKERKNLYPLILTDREVSVETTGYLDTGNCLEEKESGQGVHIVTERIWNLFRDSQGERTTIPYRTVGNPYGVMEGLRIEKMEIRRHVKNIKIEAPWIAKAPYGLSGNGGYEVLLNGNTSIREDKEGGTTIGY